MLSGVKGNLTIRYLRRLYWSIWTEVCSKRMSDEGFIRRSYRKATGREPDLINPTRYTEIQQWLKLFYRNPLMPRCSDKQELKSYLSEIGHGEMAVKTIGVYDSVDDIDFAALPDRFVMKATHGSGWNLICKDKSQIDWKRWKRLFRIWLKQNPFWFGREWNYKEIKPRIIVEEYLEDDSGELRDYKVFCFNGNATYMQIDENRSSNHKRKYYDARGKLMDIADSHNYNGELNVIFGESQFKMFEVASELSKPFPLVRVDFYELSGRLYIGEFTFFDGSGFFSFSPDSTDTLWGGQIQLPEPNYNMDLLQKSGRKK